MTVKREGRLSSIQAKLENGVKRGLILSATLVAQRATGKAPIDTGRLKRSITAGMPTQIDTMAWIVEVGTNVEYAAAQEFGVGARAEDPGKSKVPQRLGNYPHPYLRPALRESKDDVKKIIANSVAGALK